MSIPEKKKDLAAMRADTLARATGHYDPQKQQDFLDGKFEPLFDNDEEFEDFMRILEESRESQRYGCQDE